MQTTAPTYHKGFFFFTAGMGMASTSMFAYHIGSGRIPSDMTGVLAICGALSCLITLASVVWRHALFAVSDPAADTPVDGEPSQTDTGENTTTGRPTTTVGHAIMVAGGLGALIFAGYHIFQAVQVSAYGESALAIPLDTSPIARTVDQTSAPYFPFTDRFQDGVYCAATGPVIVAIARDGTDRVVPMPDKALEHAQALCRGR